MRRTRVRPPTGWPRWAVECRIWKDRLVARLEEAGVLGEVDRDGGGILPNQVTHPLADGAAEASLVEAVRAGVDEGSGWPPGSASSSA